MMSPATSLMATSLAKDSAGMVDSAGMAEIVSASTTDNAAHASKVVAIPWWRAWFILSPIEAMARTTDVACADLQT